MRERVLTIMIFIGLAAFAACRDPGPLSSRGGVQVSFATRAPVTTPAPVVMAQPAGDTIRSGSNTLVIDQAEMILRQIELKRSEATACQGGVTGCEEVEIGPLLVDLPLGGTPQQRLTVDIPEGTYDQVDFEIHKLTTDQPDAALRAQRPDMVDRSIKVRGSWNGAAFTFETDLDVEQELSVSPPLVVASETSTNLTLRVVLADWFRDAAGVLIDPATANKGGPNESIVKNRIKDSMKAFEDRDRDGDEG